MKSNNYWFAKAVSVALLGAGAAAPDAALAQYSENWQFRATIYGYFPELSATTAFPAAIGGSNISVDADTILDNLDFVFFGAFEAQKGHWGFFTDFMYLDLSGSKGGTRDFSVGNTQIPGNVTADLSLDFKGWVWTLAGSYRAVSAREATLDVFAGARGLSVETKLGYQLSGDVGSLVGPGRQGSSTVEVENWDAIIGAKGRLNFGPQREWFIPYYIDVGTGDSDLTWQAMAGIGYAFSWGDIVAAWRYLDYDLSSGHPTQSLELSGPAIAVAFRW